MVVRQMEEKASEPLRIMWRADSEFTGGSNGIGISLHLEDAIALGSQVSLESLHLDHIEIQVFQRLNLGNLLSKCTSNTLC